MSINDDGDGEGDDGSYDWRLPKPLPRPMQIRREEWESSAQLEMAVTTAVTGRSRTYDRVRRGPAVAAKLARRGDRVRET